MHGCRDGAQLRFRYSQVKASEARSGSRQRAILTRRDRRCHTWLVPAVVQRPALRRELLLFTISVWLASTSKATQLGNAVAKLFPVFERRCEGVHEQDRLLVGHRLVGSIGV